MRVRSAAIRVWLAVPTLVGGCAGSGQHAAPTRAPEAASAVQTEPVDVPIPSGCSVPDHMPFPSDPPEARPDVAPEPITKVPPEYPRAAADRNISGVVRLRVLVCEHGRVVEARAVHSVPELDQAAAEALRKWRFKPALRDGQPVAAWVEEPVRFSIGR